VLAGGYVDRPGFTGHVKDAQTGMNYMQQRYYDPMIGRFLSVDPVTATSVGGNFNRYWYANDNPYRFIDPDGRQTSGTCTGSMLGCPTQTQGAPQNALGAGNGSGSVATKTSSNASVPSDPSDRDSGKTDSSTYNEVADALGLYGGDLTESGRIFDVSSLWHDIKPAFLAVPNPEEGLMGARFLGGRAADALMQRLLASKLLGPGGRIIGNSFNGGSSILRINSNPVLRIGWGWKGTRSTGNYVFRISGNWIEAIRPSTGHIDLWVAPAVAP
jgi:RHS repeat-associated protein